MPIDKVLVADDDTFSREFLYETLKDRYEVVIAGDGEDAWEKFQREPTDVVFTDMRMPGMTGMELLEKIRNSNPETAIIMVTAFGAVEDAVEAMKLGAFDYLLKPISPDQVDVRMQKLEEHYALKSENKYLKELIEEQQEGIDDMIAEDPRMVKIMGRPLLPAQRRACSGTAAPRAQG
ncbi:MAG TPA: response regulator, partial [Rhodospirillales bacterium]|nr:response regulator [Rhodospirillales bacterium]